MLGKLNQSALDCGQECGNRITGFTGLEGPCGPFAEAALSHSAARNYQRLSVFISGPDLGFPYQKSPVTLRVSVPLWFLLPNLCPYLYIPMEITEKRLPVSVYAESTPNPATMRFVVGRPLVPEGRLMEFTSPEEAEAVSPLAAKVFNLPFVTGVFISGNFVTVTKNNSIDWDMVQGELREYIQEYLNTDGRVVLSDAPAQSLADANERAVSHAKPNSKDEEQIIAVLEEYVRPNVESDGGHIAFKSFKDGILAVSLRGSCSGCPSSMVTLKGGIENLMKQMVPGVREVVAEEL